jgi:hypothetical protein
MSRATIDPGEPMVRPQRVGGLEAGKHGDGAGELDYGGDKQC